jgi:hypothetical protein
VELNMACVHSPRSADCIDTFEAQGVHWIE